MIASLSLGQLLIAAALAGGAWWLLRPTVVEVSAWDGAGAIKNPERAIARAKALGLTGLELFVNDASKDRVGPVAFYTYDRAQIVAAVKLIKAAGLRCTLATWITPREDWIEGMRTVRDIAREAGAAGVTLDIEEPWTAIARESDQTIATKSQRVIANLRGAGELGGTAIVYTNQRATFPLLRLCDIAIPQVYDSDGNTAGRPPGGLLDATVNQWAPLKRPMVIGLMADVSGYNQPDSNATLRVSLAAVKRLGFKRVRVWWQPTITTAQGQTLAAWRTSA